MSDIHGVDLIDAVEEGKSSSVVFYLALCFIYETQVPDDLRLAAEEHLPAATDIVKKEIEEGIEAAKLLPERNTYEDIRIFAESVSDVLQLRCVAEVLAKLYGNELQEEIKEFSLVLQENIRYIDVVDGMEWVEEYRDAMGRIGSDPWWLNEKNPWFRFGELHTTIAYDGPAVEFPDGEPGVKKLSSGMTIHRGLDGKVLSVEWGGDVTYVRNGVRHSVHGPAIIFRGGRVSWHVDGRDISYLVRELMWRGKVGKDTHLGILAEYWAERGDFRLLDIISPYLVESI